MEKNMKKNIYLDGFSQMNFQYMQSWQCWIVLHLQTMQMY